MNISLVNFFWLIWLPLFISLLIITIILAYLYIRKKRKARFTLLSEREKIERQEKIRNSLIQILNEFERNYSSEHYINAILSSYLQLRNFLNNDMEIKTEDYITEKETIEVYKKVPLLYPVHGEINKLYDIYEKIRFGEKDPSKEEVQEFRSALKKIVEILSAYNGIT